MDWNDATWWWIASGVLIAAEMTTGTFYLLMLALGLVAAALAAHAGLGFGAQLTAAALIGGGAVATWHWRRQHAPKGAPVSANRDLNLDIGERVQVAEWRPDGSTQVLYRGASWSARYAGEGTPEPGDFVIRAVEGSRLLLGR